MPFKKSNEGPDRTGIRGNIILPAEEFLLEILVTAPEDGQHGTTEEFLQPPFVVAGDLGLRHQLSN